MAKSVRRKLRPYDVEYGHGEVISLSTLKEAEAVASAVSKLSHCARLFNLNKNELRLFVNGREVTKDRNPSSR